MTFYEKGNNDFDVKNLVANSQVSKPTSNSVSYGVESRADTKPQAKVKDIEFE